MSTKTVNKKLSIREYRSQVAALKRAGLITAKIDARSHKPTRYMQSQIKKYKDVIDGKAKTVKVGSRTEASEYADLYRSKFNRVVVRTQNNEKARYVKSDKTIRIDRTSPLPGIEKITQILGPKSDTGVPKLPRDTAKARWSYSIPFRVGSSIRRRFYNTQKELLKVIFEYEPPEGRFKDIRDYIEIVKIEGNESYGKKGKRKTSPKSEKGTNTGGKKKTPATKRSKTKKETRTPKKSRRNTRK